MRVVAVVTPEVDAGMWLPAGISRVGSIALVAVGSAEFASAGAQNKTVGLETRGRGCVRWRLRERTAGRGTAAADAETRHSKPMQAVGGLFAMSADAVKFVFRRPFQWREFLEQSWFVARVALAPTLLVAIPFTVLVSFTLNILLARTGRRGSVRCGCGVRCGHPGRPAGDGVDRGGRRCDGDVRGPGFANDPRRNRRDGSAGHQPGAAAGHAAHAGFGTGGLACSTAWSSSSASWAATSFRCSSKTSIPARSRRASPC